jgi:hypothetical protein
LAEPAAQPHVEQRQQPEAQVDDGVAVPLLLAGMPLSATSPIRPALGTGWNPSAAPAADEQTAGPGVVLSDAAQAERSTAMMHVGMMLTGVGIASAVGGFVSVAIGESEQASCRDCADAGLEAGVAGASFFGAAGLSLLVGIPLWAIGASEAERSADDAGNDEPSGAPASPIPQVNVGLGSVQLDWRF